MTGRGLIRAVLAVALVAGCQPASDRPVPLAVRTGTADASEGAILIETEDWTYSVPVEGLVWIDAAGVRHDSGRPDCLPAGAVVPIEFAAVEVSVEGATWRPVVWVSCR